MGETINRTDIQHALSSALHDVRNDVSRMTHIIETVPRLAQDVRDLSRRMACIEQNVNQIQNIVANTIGRPVTNRYPDPYVVGMVNDLTSLKQRFSAVEKFAVQMADYVRLQNQRLQDDKEYRSA
ncbi:MAG TPA: hypothetical protein VF597_00770 [Candidatus Saccharimonadales bacterium]|jgi:hypothetical protein